ncbi:hypothetical protein [Streptomyces sp. N35]|uniref:hypothetical protein n=1 Tax=Streptomyces sp. N35 TaxID=2795730 RepID=UPI0018F5674C|nr:hypothetical protein [Streptomyces sp. N35]
MTYPPPDDRLRHLLAQHINSRVTSWNLAFAIAGDLVHAPEVRAELDRIATAHSAGQPCGDRTCTPCAATDSRTAEGTPVAVAWTTSIQVSVLPEDNINRKFFTINVEYRGANRWAVARHGECLSIGETWEHEPTSSERDEAWLATHRFDLATALHLAKQTAPHLCVNGETAVDSYRRTQATT